MNEYLRGNLLLLAQIIALCLNLRSGAVAAESNREVVVPVGSFGSLQAAGEHCNGESIDLWKSAGSIVGIVSSCAGLVETKKTTAITNQLYEENKGRIEFTIKLSIGTDYLPGGKEVPSDDVWEYRLQLRRNTLAGTVAISDKNFPDEKPKIKSLSLQQRKRSLPSFANVDDWTRWIAANAGDR